MTKDEYRKELIKSGYIEDRLYVNRLTKGNNRCHLKHKSYKIETLVNGVWRSLSSGTYSKIKVVL